MGFACWWSCIGKGLRLQPLFVTISYYSKVNHVGSLEADKLEKAGFLYVSIIGFPASRFCTDIGLLRYDKYVIIDKEISWIDPRPGPHLICSPGSSSVLL